VNSALLKFFLQDKRLLSHLHSLRSHFFLLDGEFGRNMTSMLFERMYQVACPVDLLNCVTLNSILSKALTRPDPNMDRLSFDVKYIPPHFSFSLPSLLDCIMLQYKVDWPLNIIFTDAALHKYNEVSTVSRLLKGKIILVHVVCVFFCVHVCACARWSHLLV
jgi:hypothetical protein